MAKKMVAKFEDLPEEIREFIEWTENSDGEGPDERDLWLADILLEAFWEGATIDQIQEIWNLYSEY